jgi:hypothetical protein
MYHNAIFNQMRHALCQSYKTVSNFPISCSDQHRQPRRATAKNFPDQYAATNPSSIKRNRKWLNGSLLYGGMGGANLKEDYHI